MKNVLVIGSTGQIGSELTMNLRKIYRHGRIVAGFIPGAEPAGDLLESGPAEHANVCNAKQIADIVDKYDIDTIYNLAALLSATAERLPLKAWDIQMNGLINVLEVAREKHCAVFTPSSIGSFGPDTPRDNTPQDTIQRPTSMYGVTKVATELLRDYYFNKYGVDTRSVRFPGLISYKTLPGGGTTDHAVEIYYAAVKGEEFVCPLAHGTYLDMMYMPDAIKAAINLMEANPRYLVHRNSFNIASMSFDPEGVFDAIKKHIPTFTMRYEVDPVRQAIADSWPNKMDDVCARKEWGWTPSYTLESMTKDMLKHLREKLLGEPASA
ncbi:MAG: NAD-dependent epimerase/dehydratase family protein [Bacteroidales bacterium]|nr:NAD-dependent epimerase/dehydratase family protein [Bacteroidales bacterium]